MIDLPLKAKERAKLEAASQEQIDASLQKLEAKKTKLEADYKQDVIDLEVHNLTPDRPVDEWRSSFHNYSMQVEFKEDMLEIDNEIKFIQDFVAANPKPAAQS